MGKTAKKLRPIDKVLLGVLGVMIFVNLLAVFSPELGFDAIWYHLTLAKLFLLQHRWFFPGGLLYYSAMPRLGETLFIPVLALIGTTGPKLLQFAAGLISFGFTFKLARLFLSRTHSLLAGLLFYCTWLVSWQSGSAYVDLIRTAFEIGAVYFLVKNEFEKTARNWIIAGILIGLAIGTKLHALATLILLMFLFSPWIAMPAVLVSLPWFLIAIHFTGHPLYPLNEPFMKATQLAQVPANFLSLPEVLKRWVLLPLELAKPIDDLLNPLLGLVVPAGMVLAWKTKNTKVMKLVLLGLGGLVVWQLIPPPSSRYLLPYLPILCVLAIYCLQIKKWNKLIGATLLASIFVVIGARAWANQKYLPYLLHRQTQNEFLTTNARRLPGTFIDSDDWIEKNIPKNQRVLVDSLHNLYYLPVDFDHTSWASKQNQYSYLITQGADPKLVGGELLHTNNLGIQVFKL